MIDIKPAAARLVCAVHDADRADVAEVLTGLDTGDLYALAVLLAASVRPDDKLVIDTSTAKSHFAGIVTASCRAVGISEDDFHERTRTTEVAKARHIAAWVAAGLGYNRSETGRMLGRDHSTIVHSIEVVTSHLRLYDLAKSVLDSLQESESEAA